ncbi:MAG: DUF983 domain-containing protein [Isosphaeraceae bacterium]
MSGGPAIASRRRSILRSIAERRCPVCREGRVFRALFTMNDQCPVCALRFDRGDPGYFTGAMYVSYAMAIPLITLLTAIEWLVLPGRWTLFRLVLLAWALTIPLIPWIWQYSRVVFMHFDHWADPIEPTSLSTHDSPPGPVEDVGAGPDR